MNHKLNLKPSNSFSLQVHFIGKSFRSSVSFEKQRERYLVTESSLAYLRPPPQVSPCHIILMCPFDSPYAPKTAYVTSRHLIHFFFKKEKEQYRSKMCEVWSQAAWIHTSVVLPLTSFVILENYLNLSLSPSLSLSIKYV